MARLLIPRDYVVAQALELLAGLGLQARPDRSGGARSVLDVLHRAIKDPSLDVDTGGLLRAEASLVAGRLETARRTLEELVASPGTSDAVRGLALDRQGDLCWWVGDYGGAAELYRRSLHFRPNDQRTRKDLARALFHMGDPGEVIDVFGADSARGVETQPGESERTPTPDGVHEVNGLYVSNHGAGIMVVQGCAESEPGMVVTGSLGTMAHEACDLA
jgi:tetratricopeptide (TPR) repeat protein